MGSGKDERQNEGRHFQCSVLRQSAGGRRYRKRLGLGRTKRVSLRPHFGELWPKPMLETRDKVVEFFFVIRIGN